MDYDLELKFQKVKDTLEESFGGGLDVQSIMFLIGVNELGIGHKDFTKKEKTELLHVAVCTLLEPYGYYEFEGRDDENWPHFKVMKQLPALNNIEQQHLMKEAMIAYFSQNDYVDLQDTTA